MTDTMNIGVLIRELIQERRRENEAYEQAFAARVDALVTEGYRIVDSDIERTRPDDDEDYTHRWTYFDWETRAVLTSVVGSYDQMEVALDEAEAADQPWYHVDKIYDDLSKYDEPGHGKAALFSGIPESLAVRLADAVREVVRDFVDGDITATAADRG